MSDYFNPVTTYLQKAVGFSMILKNLILPLFIALNINYENAIYFGYEFWDDLYNYGFLETFYLEFVGVPSLIQDIFILYDSRKLNDLERSSSVVQFFLLWTSIALMGFVGYFG